MTDKLKQCRTQIDRIDDELLKLVNQRAALAQQIGHLKNNDTVLRPEREAQILRRIQDNNSGPLSNESVAQLYIEIMSQCRALEAPLRVAYLGPHGTFSEAAVFQRFGQATEGIPADCIDAVFSSVESGAANYGLVPVENSTEGAIGRTLDLLLNSNLKICGEVLLQVHQCVLSNENDLSLIRKVYSHPQSFGQCQGWLHAHLPQAERVTASSNADAARLAAEESFAAAVAGEQAAEHFKLKVLAHNIEDDARNTTRFLVIGKQDVAPSGKDKTSLAMSAPNRPGAMHDLLTPFAKNGVSMTKLESRPRPNRPWEYMFFIDFEGNVAEPRVATALEALRTEALYLKVLGCYPAKATPQVAQASEVKPTEEAAAPEPPSMVAAKPALRLSKHYKLADRATRSEDTIVRVGDLLIGGSGFVVIAGPRPPFARWRFQTSHRTLRIPGLGSRRSRHAGGGRQSGGPAHRHGSHGTRSGARRGREGGHASDRCTQHAELCAA